ncbi:MAG: exodeoxyribonuclease VII small subunit [Cyanobacteriota bacterium]|nr:exodeoxyribonuclease VII small subunit [Cyanobacteriota bacterium]
MTDPPSDGAKPRARATSRPATSSAAATPEGLSYREAQAALEQTLVELQADDLDVERMTEVYQRACAYADRCDTLLQTVEAQVLLWDPDQPDRPPQPQNP